MPLEKRIEYVEKHLTLSSDKPFPDGSFAQVAPISTGESAAVLLFFAVVMGGPMVSIAAVLTTLFTGSWRALLGLTAGLGCLALHPLPSANWLITSRFTLCLYKYFSYRWVWVDDIVEHNNRDAKVGWIGAGAPHGVLPIANVLSMPSINAFSRKRFLGGSASVVLRTPFLRYMTLFGGAVDVSGPTLTKETHKGHCVGIVPDGIAGIFQQRVSQNGDVIEERVALKKRKGLAKLSLRKGIPIVPAYSLGNTAVYKSWYDSCGIMEKLSRVLQMSIFVFWGRFGLPLPFRTPITMLVGRAILPEKVEDAPSTETIDKVHEEILEGIRTTFDTHKGACGWGHRVIKFV